MLGPGVREFCVDIMGRREPQKFPEKGVQGQKWYLKKIVGVIGCKAVFQGKEELGRHVKRNSVRRLDSQMNLDFIASWKVASSSAPFWSPREAWRLQ